MRFSLLVPVVLVLPACGVPDADDPADTGGGPFGTSTSGLETGAEPTTSAGAADTGTDDAGTTTDDLPPPIDPAGGWTLRDDTPYGRAGHVAILDEEGDRMIVFGGGANDTWELPLSGPRAHRWAPLAAAGEHPPVHGYGGSMFADTAVHDPAGRRMLVLLNATPATASPDPEVALWELTLTGTPTWRRIVAAGPSPGLEVQSGRLALDRAGDRLFVVGGALADTGVWTLSLGEAPTWSRFADTPPGVPGPFYVDASLVLDEQRGMLVLFGGHARLAEVWGLSLATATWTLLDEGQLASSSYGSTALLDAANDRILIFGGDQISAPTVFSLADHAWSAGDWVDDELWPQAASGVLDARRGRALYFAGTTGWSPAELRNNVVAVGLADLAVTEAIAATRRVDAAMDERLAVWDPVRAAVVAFGDFEGQTWTHGLAAGDGWEAVGVGQGPKAGWMTAIHDPVGAAIVAFAGSWYTETNTVMRLRSSADAVWETLPVDGGPAARNRHTAVYDAANRRMVVYGGVADEAWEEPYGDVWALTLDGPPVWTELAPGGPQPAARHGHLAVHDAAASRMIVVGGQGAIGGALGDVWSLALAGAPKWTRIMPSGTGPGAVPGASAVWDPAGRRMIVLDFEDAVAGAAEVFALELGEAPAWRRFCAPTLVPAARGTTHTPNAVLVDDGLWVTISGGAFRFDLATDYCD